MKLSRLVALLGSIVTLVQIVLLASEREGICFNDGCRVVDSLTTVPPLFFNIGGFLFFQAVFWGLWFARNDRWRLSLVNALLIAGLAAEGVLLSFQHVVARTFCSYCLIILAFVVLLNLLAGISHFVRSAAVFGAVLIGFASLQFAGGKPRLDKLDDGTFAVLQGMEIDKKYLFFSSTCKYCEEVIASLQGGDGCTIRFNPIDEIKDFRLAEAQRSTSYRPEVNRDMLQSLGLEQIPVLLVTSQSGFEVIKGSGPIQDHLAKNCVQKQDAQPTDRSRGFSQAPSFDFLAPQDESCSVNTDCEEPQSGEKQE